jgi:hypothetical protein
MQKFIGCAGFFLSANLLAAEPVVIDDWLVSIDDVACWISTHPIKRSSVAGIKQHDLGMYFNVAFQNGSSQPEFSISKTAIEKHNKTVGVKVGSRVFEFIADKDIVFSKISEDRDILFQMLGGNGTSFQLNQSDNLKPVNFYISLEGFRSAYNHIAKECNFSANSGAYKNMSSVDILYYSTIS